MKNPLPSLPRQRGNQLPRPGIIAVYLLLLIAALPAHSQTAQLRWDTQLDRPVAHNLIIYRGETLDLLPRIVQGTDPVTITNTALTFVYREPALASSNLYRQATCTTNSAPGTLQYTWAPTNDVGSSTYDYEFWVGDNPRVHGRITMRGTIGYPASTNAPPPATRYITDYDLSAHAQYVDTQLNNFSNYTHAVATNLTTRLSQPDGSSWTEIINGTQMLYTVISTTNIGYTVTVSSDPSEYGAVGQTYWYHSTEMAGGGDYYDYYDLGTIARIQYCSHWTAGAYPWLHIYSGQYAVGAPDAPHLDFSHPQDPYNHFNLRRTQAVDVITNVHPIATESYVADAIATIPAFPTNYTAGIILPDAGTNVNYTLIVTNGLLSLWEILP